MITKRIAVSKNSAKIKKALHRRDRNESGSIQKGTKVLETFDEQISRIEKQMEEL